MARRLVLFDDWDNGEYHLRGAENAPKGSFSGQNLLVTRRSEVIPRLGMEEITTTGTLSTTAVSHAGIDFSGNIFIIQGTAIRSIQQNATSWNTAATALDVSPSAASAITRGGTNLHYYTDRTDSDSYSINTASSTPVVTKLANSPGGKAIALFGERLCIGSTDSTTNRNVLQFSAASDYTDWPTENVIRIGSDQSDINAMYVQNGNLLISKPEGWFIITGTLGVTETLRQLNNLPGPATQANGAVTNRDMLVYSTNLSRHPYVFNGTYGTRVDHLIAESDFKVHGIQSEENAAIMWGNFFSTSDTTDALLYHKGIWTRHQFPSQSDPLQDDLAFILAPPGEDPFTNQDTLVGARLYFVVKASGENPRLFNLHFDNDTLNPNADGVTGLPGDGTDTAKVQATLDLPEWWSDEGSDILVRGLMVDFRPFNQSTSNGVTNHFDVTVESRRLYDGSSPFSSQTESFDQPEDQADGSRMYRKFFSFGDQGQGNGFQIRFSNIRGLAIRRVFALIESSSVRM